jgi:hypothetical protein
MRYDGGYGRHGGWEQRMPDGGRGWDGGYPDARRGEPVERPWVGGYREGYQGGSGGYALRTSGPLYAPDAYGDEPRERGYRRPRGQQGRGGEGGGYFVRARASYGGDYGNPGGGFGGSGRYGADFGGSGRMRGGYGRDYDGGMRGGRGGYDLPFRNEGRPEDYHPRYSPIGGTYAPMGGSRAVYRAGEVPRPLHDTWTSHWTRWF